MADSTSIDCKNLQYQYGIYKLEHYCNANYENLPLMNYIVILPANVFAIHSAFESRLESLSNYKPIKHQSINITGTSHIPYDTSDSGVIALDQLPDLETAKKCVEQFESLATMALQGYRKKLGKQTVNIKLVQSIFHDDFDLHLEKFTFQLPKGDMDENLSECCLIDIDIQELFVINKGIESSINYIKTIIPTNEDTSFIQKVFLINIRLNELYTILRRFGRKIFLSNQLHLNDSKLLHHSSPVFRQNMKLMNDHFNTMKKNGCLIANITKFLRGNMNNIDPSLLKFTTQGITIIENTNKVLKEFGQNWILAELRFRKIYQLPKSTLLSIHNTYTSTKVPETKNRSRSSSNSSTNSLLRRSSISSPKKSIMSPKKIEKKSEKILEKKPELKSEPKPEKSIETERESVSDKENNISNTEIISEPKLETKLNQSPESNASPKPANKSTVAASGAAAAIKKKPDKEQLSPTPIDQIANKVSEVAIQESEKAENGRLSASQRFHLHFAKSGEVNKKSIQVFEKVSYDPSRTNQLTRKYIDQPVTTESITKKNTRQNIAIEFEPIEEHFNGDGSKKVRFTGVPEYTEAEDAPTKYAHALLRNFAIFKKPVIKHNKSDQLLKEESLSFRARHID